MGGFTKQAVREMAAERGLPTASRPDSQDLCFVADGDYRRFLSAYAAGAIRPGPIVEAGGRVLGEHRGLPFYTIGQRSGLGIAAAQPLYVIAMDAETNVLRVGPAPEAEQRTLRAGPARWVAGQPPADRFAALVQLRYRAHPAPAAVTLTDDGGFEAHFDSPQRGIAPGQAAVLYDGDRVLGQGTIS
jgi:tRNA-specific 2-thiouridylase